MAFIYREEIYKRDREDMKGLADLIIAKQRNGPSGRCRCGFWGSLRALRIAPRIWRTHRWSNLKDQNAGAAEQNDDYQHGCARFRGGYATA